MSVESDSRVEPVPKLANAQSLEDVNALILIALAVLTTVVARAPEGNWASLLLILSAALILSSIRPRKFSQYQWAPVSLQIVGVSCLAYFLCPDLPAFGWDALSEYLDTAVAIAIQDDAAVMEAEASRHPLLMRQFLALPVILNMKAGAAILPAGFFWTLFGVLFFTTIFAYAQRMLRNRFLTLIVATSAITPLLENHILIYGYAELLTTLALVHVLILLDQAITTGNFNLHRLGVFIGVCTVCISSKNTGFVYLTAVCLAAVLCPIQVKYQKWLDTTTYRTAINTLAWAIIVAFGVLTFEWLGSQGLPWLHLAGKGTLMRETNLGEIFIVYKHAFFSNSSFSVLPALVVIRWLSLLFGRSKATYLDLALIALFAILLLSLYTDHGYSFATPTRDTGNSRFHLPVFGACSILLVKILSELREKSRGEFNSL